MPLKTQPKRYRFPVEIISHVVWEYHRFNDSYRDIKERLMYRGILVSHKTIRLWCLKFGPHFFDVIKKREAKPSDKWHLDEMVLRINGERFYLWRAVDSEGYELDVFLQKRRNKRSATRFLSRLLGSYPKPRVIITDKLRSYIKPIKYMCKSADHRRHKGLNNRVENAHQPTRRKEQCLIKFKSPKGTQHVLSLMGKTRNIFAVAVGRYLNSAEIQRIKFSEAKEIWEQATSEMLCA
jgi:putative transposase